jgi:hypothetical protein
VPRRCQVAPRRHRPDGRAVRRLQEHRLRALRRPRQQRRLPAAR